MNRILKDALLSRASPYYSVLPYNLNWMNKLADGLLSCLKGAPITLVDVGCRGGLPCELYPLKSHINYIGFDADEEECRLLNLEPHDLHARTLYPNFIDEIKGRRDFFIYQSPGESSAFHPDERYKNLFRGDSFGEVKTISVETISLDEFIKQHALPSPDVIKLDTQGTELSILKGAGKCLELASLVEVEVEFVPLYKGQPLFPEIMNLMADHGFECIFLNRVFQQRKAYKGLAKGQLIFADAVFAKREDRMAGFDVSRLIKAIVLLINYGHIDIAFDVFRANKWPEDVQSLLEPLFVCQDRGKRCLRLKAGVTVMLDKLILLLLYLRKHNGLPCDSDRSWPVR